jgi:DNA-binding MurR/RpiR family transcriptional regulator
MLTLEVLKDRIRERLPQMSRAEKTIAAFLLERHKEVALLSIQELSRRLNIGRASIVRFANKLGANGYAGLKTVLKESLQEELDPLERFNVRIAQKQMDGLPEIFVIAQQEVENINSTLHLLDRKTFQKGVEMVHKAESIYTLGVGISDVLARLTAYSLRRIGQKAFHLDEGGLRFTEQLITAERHDLMIAFSLPPYSSQTIDAALFARQQGMHVIGVTNSPTSPIVEHAHLYFVAKTESPLFSNSLSAIILLINAIASNVASRNRRRSRAVMNKMIGLRQGKRINHR